MSSPKGPDQLKFDLFPFRFPVSSEMEFVQSEN